MFNFAPLVHKDAKMQSGMSNSQALSTAAGLTAASLHTGTGEVTAIGKGVLYKSLGDHI